MKLLTAMLLVLTSVAFLLVVVNHFLYGIEPSNFQILVILFLAIICNGELTRIEIR